VYINKSNSPTNLIVSNAAQLESVPDSMIDSLFKNTEHRLDFMAFVQHYKKHNLLNHKLELNVLKMLISGMKGREIDEHLGLKKGVSFYFINKLRASYSKFVKEN